MIVAELHQSYMTFRTLFSSKLTILQHGQLVCLSWKQLVKLGEVVFYKKKKNPSQSVERFL
jgi:hypothetical protein